MNVLKLIMTLVAEKRDESFRIIANLLELIVGCTVDCQLSHRAAGKLCFAFLRILPSL